MSSCLRSCSSRGHGGHFLQDLAVNLSGWVDDIDKMPVSPKRTLWYDTDAVSTRLTPYDPQCEQKLSCLVSFITVRHSLPDSSVQVVEWQSGRTDHVCVKMQQLFFYFHSPSLPPPLQTDCCSTLCTVFKGCRLANNKMPSHLYPEMSHEPWMNSSIYLCILFSGKHKHTCTD